MNNPPRVEVIPIEDGATTAIKLSKKHQAFTSEYLKCWNSSEAARRSGYRGKANVVGPRLLADVCIKAEITKRLAEMHMGADEVLKLLADMARGDMGEFLDVSGMGFNLDLQDAKARGLTKLIKKVKQKTTIFIAKKESEEDREVHELEIELYDAQAALEKVGRHLDIFPNKLDLTLLEGIVRVIEHDDGKQHGDGA